MIDVQKLFDTISNAAREDRKRYHLTLGGLISALNDVPDDAIVETDNGFGLGEPDSYRGFYHDLSFSPVSPSTAREAREIVAGCIGKTFEGYKGGEFVMGEDTPLWLAGYGDCTGIALIDARMVGSKIIITTKVIN